MTILKKSYKKIIASLMLSFFCTVCLSGCAKKPQTIAAVTVFKCSFSTDIDGTAVSGELNMTDENAVITAKEPATLNGLIITVPANTEKIKISYMGLNIDLDEGKYPKAAFARLICGVLRNINTDSDDEKYNKTASPAEYDESTNSFHGEYDGAKYTLLLDEKHRPKSLNIPNYSLKINFDNYQTD